MTRKRVRQVLAKPGELKAAWGRAAEDGPDICGAWQEPGARKADMNLLLGWLSLIPLHGGKTFTAELKERGYDLTTLRFSVRHTEMENQNGQ